MRKIWNSKTAAFQVTQTFVDLRTPGNLKQFFPTFSLILLRTSGNQRFSMFSRGSKGNIVNMEMWCYISMLGTKSLKNQKAFVALYNICENTYFHWPVFYRIRTESMILFLYRRTRFSKNSRVFYAV